MSRRQLEFEARQIRSAMEEQLGSCQEMERRAQVPAPCLFAVWLIVKCEKVGVVGSSKLCLNFVCLVCPQARVSRIQQIEKDILRFGARLQV